MSVSRKIALSCPSIDRAIRLVRDLEAADTAGIIDELEEVRGINADLREAYLEAKEKNESLQTQVEELESRVEEQSDMIADMGVEIAQLSV